MATSKHRVSRSDRRPNSDQKTEILEGCLHIPRHHNPSLKHDKRQIIESAVPRGLVKQKTRVRERARPIIIEETGDVSDAQLQFVQGSVFSSDVDTVFAVSNAHQDELDNKVGAATSDYAFHPHVQLAYWVVWCSQESGLVD